MGRELVWGWDGECSVRPHSIIVRVIKNTPILFIPPNLVPLVAGARRYN